MCRLSCNYPPYERIEFKIEIYQVFLKRPVTYRYEYFR